MTLTEQERRTVEAMEARLALEDPQLAQRLTEQRRGPRWRQTAPAAGPPTMVPPPRPAVAPTPKGLTPGWKVAVGLSAGTALLLLIASPLLTAGTALAAVGVEALLAVALLPPLLRAGQPTGIGRLRHRRGPRGINPSAVRSARRNHPVTGEARNGGRRR